MKKDCLCISICRLRGVEEPKLRGGAESPDDGDAAVPRESEAAASAAEAAAGRAAAEAEAAAGAIAAEAQAQGFGSPAAAAPHSTATQSAAIQRQHSFLDDSIQVRCRAACPMAACTMLLCRCNNFLRLTAQLDPVQHMMQFARAHCVDRWSANLHRHAARWLAQQQLPRPQAAQPPSLPSAAALEQQRQAPAPHQSLDQARTCQLLQGRRRRAASAPLPPRRSSPRRHGSRKRRKVRTATAGTPAPWAASSTTAACRRRQLQRPWRLTTGAQVTVLLTPCQLYLCTVCAMLAGCVWTTASSAL
jgi:hypothetical protein